MNTESKGSPYVNAMTIIWYLEYSGKVTFIEMEIGYIGEGKRSSKDKTWKFSGQ